MSHAEFVEAYAAGRIKAAIDSAAAARFVNARLLLPLVMLPFLGIGVAAALLGWIWTGLAIIALAIAARWIVKRSAPHFVLAQSLADADFYRAAVEQHVLRIAHPA